MQSYAGQLTCVHVCFKAEWWALGYLDAGVCKWVCCSLLAAATWHCDQLKSALREQFMHSISFHECFRVAVGYEDVICCCVPLHC